MTALLTETARDLTRRLDEELRRREGERLMRHTLRHLVTGADVLAEITLGAWMWVRETLEERGFEGRELAGHCQVLLRGIDIGLEGHARLRAMAEASGLSAEAAGLDHLEAKLPALREARPEVVAALALATRPPPAVAEAVLAESRAALDRGEFVNGDDDYLARLQRGEDF